MTLAVAQDVESIIRNVAAELGVSPNLAVATAKVESGLNPGAIGDNGCSVGLFQLNTCGGEGVGLSEAQLIDPETNARRALGQFARVQQASPGLSGGALAAAAQRPLDPAGYAAKIDALLLQLFGGGDGSTGPVGPVGPTGPARPTTPSQPGPGAAGGGGLGIPQRPGPDGKCPPGQVVTVFGFCAVPGTNSAGQLPDASGKYPAPPATSSGQGLVNITVPGFQAVGDFFSNLGGLFDPANWWRAGLIVGGIIAVVAGARMYLGQPTLAEGSTHEEPA